MAKVASDADKPDGFLSLSAEEARERFGGASPRLVPGIGPKTAERLEARGVQRLEQLARMGDQELSELFGSRLGPHLGRLARFEDDRELETDRVRKSESKETTFDRDLHGLEQMEPELARLAEQLGGDLERNGRGGRTVRLKVRLDDFSIHTRARTLPAPVSDAETIGSVARELLRTLDPQRPVRLLGVGVAGMEERPAAPPGDQLELIS